MKKLDNADKFLLIVGILMVATMFCQKCQAQELEKMRSHYAAVAIVDAQGIEGKATALVISPSRALVNFHSLQAGTKIITPKEIDEIGRAIATVGEIIYCDPWVDVCVVDFKANLWKPKPLKFAKEVRTGETLSMYTNALGRDGVFYRVMVSKIEREQILFTPHAAKGASGSGMFNSKGELVAMLRGTYWHDDVPCIGFATPVSVLKPIILQYKRDEPPCEDDTLPSAEDSQPRGRLP